MLLFRRQGEDGTRVFPVSSCLRSGRSATVSGWTTSCPALDFALQKLPTGSQPASRGLSQYSQAAIASRTADRPHKRYGGYILRMSVIQSESSGVTARMQSPTMSASTTATLRTGLREASHKSTPSMSTMPPISLRSDRSSVDTSPSGGRRKIRTMRGFSAKIINRPPSAANSEKARRKMRRERYGGPVMVGSFRCHRLYVQDPPHRTETFHELNHVVLVRPRF